MNEIDFPTLTVEERNFMRELENKPPPRASKLAWWLPVWLVFGFFAAFAFTFLPKPKAAATIMGHPLTIDPEITHCQSLTYLEQAAWRRVPEGENERIASNPRNRIVLFQTLVCKNGEQTFTLREPWYETARLPMRRAFVE